MKKITILFLYIIFFVWQTKAFLGDDLWNDLFKDINEWIKYLETEQIVYELSWQWWEISEKINFNLQANSLWECINEGITLTDVENIVTWDLATLQNNIKEDSTCRNENWNISVENLNKIDDIIKNIYDEIKDISQNKTKQLNYISRIWIYTDWNDNNSPFDLMSDLENIDYYIFSEEIPYEWEDIGNIDDLMSDILSGNDNNNSNWTIETQLIDDNDENTNNEIENEDENEDDTYGVYKCIDSNINSELSWLNNNEITNLLTKNSSSITNINDIFDYINEDLINMDNYNAWWNSTYSNTDNWWSSYSKINDNSQFPCEGFFCITIEFITYQHKLLAGWVTQTIDSLIWRSNQHLKKFAATSLIQSNMTTNNWELWLKDLNLPDMFHVWLVVSTKPIPMLDVQNDDSENKQNDEFTKDNLLENYYKSYWLEYLRKNDLDIFRKKEAELKILLDTDELPVTKASEKVKEYNDIQVQETNETSLVSKTVIEKVISNDSSEFEERLIEHNKFSSTILNYIQNIDSIIRQMNKEIPVDKS